MGKASPLAAISASRLTLALVLAGALALSACNKTQTAERPPEPGDVAVATVNGATIWTSDVRSEAVAQGQIGEGEPLDVTSGLFQRTLQDVIDQRLLAAQARRKGLDKSLTAQRRMQAADDRILGNMLVENSIDRHIDENAIKAQYDQQVALSKQSEDIHLRMVVLKTKADAEAVLKSLQGGAVFEAMAMEKSVDQATRFNGGDMGYLTTDILPPAYKAPLANAKVGDTVGPVQTDNGWAIFRVEDRRPEQMPTLEEERPAITQYLTDMQVGNLLKQLNDKAQVKYLIDRPKSGNGADIVPADATGAVQSSMDSTVASDAASDTMDSAAASAQSSSLAALPPLIKPKPVTSTPESALLPGSSNGVPAGHHFFAPASAGKKKGN